MTVMSIIGASTGSSAPITASTIHANTDIEVGALMDMAKEIDDYDMALHLTHSGTNFLMQAAECMMDSSKDGGITPAAASLLSAAQELLGNVANMGSETVIAAESFGVEGERSTNTVLAAEGFVEEAKAKGKQAIDWVMKQLKTFVAFVKRMFDAAPKIAARAKAIKQKAEQAQSDGKQKDGNNISLTAGQISKLAIGTSVPAGLKGKIEDYTKIVDKVYGEYLQGVSATCDAYETMVEGAKTDASNKDAVATYCNEVTSKLVQKAQFGSSVYLGNYHFTTTGGVSGPTGDAVADVVAALATVSKVKVTFTKKDDAKPKENQEYPILALGDIESLADMVSDAAETIAKAKDKANKGSKSAEKVAKALTSVQKTVENAGDSDSNTKEVSKMVEVARAQASWLNHPTATFSAVMLGSLSAALDVCTASLGKYKAK